MNKKSWAFAGFLLSISIVFVFYGLNSFSPNDERTTYKVGAWETPRYLSFAGEVVPINNIDVREKYDREILVNTYWHSQSILLIKRSSRWFPIIEPILKEQGIPNDFKYLAVIESGLDLNARSPSGAVGFWQFLKGTGKEYGLKINSEIDERRHLIKSTLAACKYLKNAKEKLGNWTLAASGFNAGVPKIKRQMEKQKAKSYYSLYLNTETSRYVYRILALKEVFNNMYKYGFDIKKEDLYMPYQTKDIKVNEPISNIPDFAKKHNTSYKMLKILNPWLMKTYLSNPDSLDYTILIPN
jgi:hypothetical protein